ncbi:hypothetical protein FD09_GL001752 [Schleiferilactobacillus perolens DSM 12744]|jgi:endoglycosylceramidase|uniref:Uncharacterized protein n=2 Tax=Schleiferilactobacillus perolens TaxID=100468 RepID=A0A0R1N096_9LACO|nr:hypothetical protein FD09_GL001752 [Schleiferilactobacillus perolens DSM 12744]
MMETVALFSSVGRKGDSSEMDKMRVSGSRFVNERGEQVLFNGINLVEKDAKNDFITPGGDALYARLAAQGINLIRFGIYWAKVEPTPGKIDEDYLGQVAAQIQLAKKHEIYVFLDMHQDLYAAKWGDGAPDWAVIDDGLPHQQGQLWSDSYFISPGLNRAIDHFWQNSPAGDGVGLQDHYLAMWQAVAKYFLAADNVIGFDLMNEPFPGSQAAAVRDTLIGYLGAKLQLSPEQLMATWLDDTKKQGLLAQLNDATLYGEILQQLTAPVQAFETSTLNPFYAKMAAGLQDLLNGKALFLEPSFFTNIGIPSAIDLSADKHAVFAPHAYDLVVDTNHFENYSTARLGHTLWVHQQVQEKWHVPLVLGEWGAYFDQPETKDISEFHILHVEQNQWSQTYWSYYDGYFTSPTAAVLDRPYPQAINGKLLGYHYDPATKVFDLSYDALPGTSRVFIPHIKSLDISQVAQQGARVDKQPIPGGDSGVLFITTGEEHRVVLHLTIE